MARKFEAAYDGFCNDCGGLIEAGDEIGYVDDQVCCGDCFDENQDDDWY